MRAFNLKSDSPFGPIRLPLLYVARLICGFYGDATLCERASGKRNSGENELFFFLCRNQ